MIQVYLYGTAGCHLCDDAHKLLLGMAEQATKEFTLRKIDIVEDDQLMERYSFSIPVLKRSDTQAELNWPFEVSELTCFLQ